MKSCILLCIMMLCATTSACAQPVAPDASSSVTTGSSLSPVYTDGQCHFRLKLVPNQGYTDSTYMFYGDKSDPVGWGFGFGCNAGASQNDINGLLAAKQINGKWMWEGTNQPFTPEQHFKVYKFSGKNWHGVATAYDDTTGDEATRGRNLFFCLIETKGPQVLCGGPVSVRALADPPSTSTFPKIMAVLKTIVFVNAPAGASVPAGTASKS